MTTPHFNEEDTLISLEHIWLKFRSVHLLQGGRLEQQLVSSYCLLVFKQGEGTLTLDLQSFLVHPDTVYVAAPGQTMGYAEVTGEKLELYVIEFDIRWDTEEPARIPLNGEIGVHDENTLHMLCDQLIACSRSDRAVEKFRGQSLFHELIFWIINHIRTYPKTDSRTAMERTKGYIEDHFRENLTIEQLARMAEISPKYYVSLFKKTYGKTAFDYVTEVRINMAKQLMLQEGARLKDIAYQVGYHDEFYFSRMFKKEVGVSPKVYLKNRRQKIAAYSSTILGQLLALKIMPYAAPLHPKWTAYYYHNYRTDIPLHLSGYRFNEDWETNVKTLTDSQADIIIATDQLHPLEQKRLEQIAPVHVIPLYKGNWRDQLRATARIVGAAEEAEVWLQGYDHRVKLVRERLTETLGTQTVWIVSLMKNSFYLLPTQGMRDMFSDLQLHAPAGSETYIQNRRGLSLEELAVFDPDHILLNIQQETETLHNWERIKNSLLWQDFRAVRNNRVHAISSDPWREYSAHASERMLHDLEELLCGYHT